MIRPNSLHEQELIGICASARSVDAETIELAKRAVEKHGFDSQECRFLRDKQGIFAGSDNRRANGLSNFLGDEDIKAIWMARGGYGSIRMVDKVNWKFAEDNPSWLIGFSDVTNLHLEMQMRNICSIHGPMPIQLKNGNESVGCTDEIFILLKGEQLEYKWEGAGNKTARLSGEIIGGNLATLYSRLAHLPRDFFKNKILFLEDVDEYYYEIDRMLWAFRQAGVFEQISALLLGQFNGLKDNKEPFGQDFFDIVSHILKGTQVVCAFNFPAGHVPNNRPFILGASHELNGSGGNWIMRSI